MRYILYYRKERACTTYKSVSSYKNPVPLMEIILVYGWRFQPIVICRFPSNYHSLDPQSRSKGFPFMRRGFDLNQIREESLVFSQVKHDKECPQSGFGFKEMCASNRLKSNLRVAPENIEENGSCDPLQVS